MEKEGKWEFITRGRKGKGEKTNEEGNDHHRKRKKGMKELKKEGK